MAELRKRQFDFPWVVAFVVGVITLLIAPRLAADSIGRSTTVILLSVAWVALVYGLTEKVSYRKMIFWLGMIGFSAAILGLGVFVWPYTLQVSSSRLEFSVSPRKLGSETYPLRVTNRSDDDVYAAELDVTLEAPPLQSINDLTIDIAAESRKPFGDSGEAAQHFADITGLLCRDIDSRAMFIITFNRLKPHESRELLVTYNRDQKAEVSAETGFYSIEARPIIMNGDTVVPQFKFSHTIRTGSCDGNVFCFLVDSKEHKGMYWLNHKDGKR